MYKRKYAASLSSILEAKARIEGFVRRTPVFTSSSLDAVAGRKLYFKTENFQKIGAFKFRGACNAVYSLEEETAARGVVTHSSGNHAAALSLAARMRGISAQIVIPRDAPLCKVENIKRYGGNLVFCDPSIEAREQTAREIQGKTGAEFISSANDGRIISGQGTVAVEFLEQIPSLDAIVVPVSGGGLISGIALAAKAIKSSIKIVAAEPDGANDTAMSKKCGKIINLHNSETIADGLRAALGHLTWPVIRDLVDEVVTVSDVEIVEAMQMCFERLKVVAEPSASVGLAAVLNSKFQKDPEFLDCKNVGIILSGGNIDLHEFWKMILKGCK